ncbi:MAG: DNA polymerase III subunit gamma/tau [Patescibacteria group bacterium]
MSVLYRDYRPQKFSEVLGQNHIKITLQNEIASGRLANAYLFCGPRAVGKTTLARVLAKAINCEKKKDGEFEPCNKCASCESITRGRNLDIVEIDAASNTGVDNVRENIISFSRLAPTSAKFKVFIIDEVHMLSISAFNALLKIIEEPPVYVVFILCTTEIQKVPQTIISRCERFDFKRISVKEIVEKLSYISSREGMTVDKEVLEAVARKSGGHLRDAESLLGQLFSLGDKKITAEQAELVIPHYNSDEAIDIIDYLSRKDAAKAIAVVNNLADSGVNLKVFVGELIALLREIMLHKLSPELADSLGLDLGDNLEKRLAAVEVNLDWEKLLAYTKRFLEAENASRNSLIAQLPLEMAIAELCFGSSRPVMEVSESSAPTRSVSSVRSSASLQANSSVRPSSSPQSAPAAKISMRPASLSEDSPAVVIKKAASKKEAGEIVGKKSGSFAPLSQAIKISTETLAAKWPEFLVKIKKYNHSLSFVLQNCEPRLNEGGLCLFFKYKFHKDRINDANIKNIVETVLAEVFGGALPFAAKLDENLELRKEEKQEVSLTGATPKPVSTSSMPDMINFEAKAGKKENKKESEVGLNSGSGLAADLLKTFGGEVVN